MFTRILVPLDGSTFAERALPHAELFARIYDAKIFLLRVLEPLIQHDKPTAVDPLTWQIRKSEAELYLQEIADRTRQRIGDSQGIPQEDPLLLQRVEYAIREGRAPESIVNFAHQENIDLVVISTHGWGGFTRWNISSVAQKVIKKIYLPILLIRAYEEAENFEQKIEYKRILVPVDSSHRAEVVLATGVSLSRGEPVSPDSFTKNNNAEQKHNDKRQSTLILATIIRPPELPIPVPYSENIQKLVASLMQYSHQAVHDYLNKINDQISVPCMIKVVENTCVSAAIQQIAHEENVDLILMAAHGYTGLNIHPYGGVTRDIMEMGSKPILVIQDIPLSQVKPSESELAAMKTGGRKI